MNKCMYNSYIFLLCTAGSDRGMVWHVYHFYSDNFNSIIVDQLSI